MVSALLSCMRWATCYGSLLLSDSTFWTHYADQEAQPHCIVCNLDAIDGWLQLRNSAILATISFCAVLTS